MKKSSSVAFISTGILATIASLATITSPVTAQVTTPRTNSQGTGTTTTYERNNDNSGLWGLAGLVGLLGFLGRGKEAEDRPTTRRDDAPAYRDPNVR